MSGGCGRVSKEGLEKIWPELQRLAKSIGDLDDEWEEIDSDGNGFLNLSEFCDFTTQRGVDLPMGLDDFTQATGSNSLGCGYVDTLRCGVSGCPCRGFNMRKPCCKYGAECYQKSGDHVSKFLHPGDDGWEEGSVRKIFDRHMCECGHKQKLHASSLEGVRLVSYPSHWKTDHSNGEEFNARFTLPDTCVPLFQDFVNATYSDVTTRDRKKSCGTWEVPRNFEVLSVQRNENSQLWRKYMLKRDQLRKESSRRPGGSHSLNGLLVPPPPMPAASSRRGFLSRLLSSHNSTDSLGSMELPDFGIYGEAKTSAPWAFLVANSNDELGLGDADLPDGELNEWLLFHGTNAAASEQICAKDFSFRLAGTTTGSLYGGGTYLAESFTKADEYAREDDGCFTVLVCRVLGGRVLYCDEKTPDADKLTRDCTEGVYDCILGDRIKASGTYREFVVFDTENVYAEYILRYKRGEFFKSATHP